MDPASPSGNEQRPDPPAKQRGDRSGTATAPLIPSSPLADTDRPWGSWRHGPVDPKAQTEPLPTLELSAPGFQPSPPTPRPRPRVLASQRLRSPAPAAGTRLLAVAIITTVLALAALAAHRLGLFPLG